MGPPRLPPELRHYIIKLCALSIPPNMLKRARLLLKLALIERAAQTFMLRLLLASPVLVAAGQVTALLNSIHREAKLRSSDRVLTFTAAKYTTRLCIRNADAAKPSWLFDSSRISIALARSTQESLRSLLAVLLQLKSLVLACPPKALQGEPGSTQERMLGMVRDRLEELVCAGSTYGSDVMPTLFMPGNSGWSNLTHLQLHGPRLNLSEDLAKSIAALPKLQHLALSMPRLPFDEQGAAAILSPLVCSPSSIKTLLVVTHNMSRYIGGARVKPALAALRTDREGDAAPRIKLAIAQVSPPSVELTAAEVLSAQPGEANVAHPTMLFNWLIARAEAGTHWCFPTGAALLKGEDDLPAPPGCQLDAAERAQEAARVDERWNVVCEVEEWVVPHRLAEAAALDEELPMSPIVANIQAMMLVDEEELGWTENGQEEDDLEVE